MRNDTVAIAGLVGCALVSALAIAGVLTMLLFMGRSVRVTSALPVAAPTAPAAPPAAAAAPTPAPRPAAPPATPPAAAAAPAPTPPAPAKPESVAVRVDESSLLAAWLKAVEPDFAAARAALDGRDFATASRLEEQALARYHQGPRARCQETMNQHVDGVGFQEWGERQRQAFGAALGAAAGALRAAAERGGAADLEAAAAWCAAAGRYPVAAEDVEAVRAVAEPARAKLARRWLRVNLQTPDARFTPVVQRGLEARWPTALPLTLVFGRPLGGQEAAATWKQLDVTLVLRPARFKRPDGGLVEVPEALEVRFRLQGSTAVPTSWDRLPPLPVKAALPDQLELEPPAKLAATVAASLEQLAQALELALATLPAFRPFPDVDPATLTLARADGRLDAQAVQAWLLLDRPAFDRELDRQLARADRPALLGELAALIVREDLTAQAAWLERYLQAAPRPAAQAALRELQRHPEFADYRLTLSLLDQPGDGGARIAHGLYGPLREQPRLRAEVRRRCQDPRHPQRTALAPALIAALPEAEQAACRDWILDADEAFGAQVFAALHDTAGHAGGDLILAYYAKGGTAVKLAMLQRLNHHPEEFPRQVLELVAGTAAAAPDDDLRRTAIACLQRAAGTADGWDACGRLGPVFGESGLLAYYSPLIHNVYRARPATADAWLRATCTRLAKEAAQEDQVKKGGGAAYASTARREARNLCLQVLAGRTADRPALCQLGLDLWQLDAHDADVQRAVLHALAGLCRRPDFKFDDENLRAILKRAVGAAREELRQQAYEILGQGARRQTPGYRVALEAAAKEEKVERLRRTLDRALAAEP